MFSAATTVLELVEEFLWTYLGFTAILLSGIWLTMYSSAAQIRLLPKAWRYLWQSSNDKEGSHSGSSHGLHPIKVFWATLGGAVGIGNIVGICSAVQIGGPGAVFWVWFVAFVGVLLKYSEVYLGLRYRVKKEIGWDGGPMFYLQHAYGQRWICQLAAMLLWIYGVEVYQFHVMVDTVVLNWQLPRLLVVLVLLLLVLWAVRGGLSSLSHVASKLVPLMIAIYLVMTGYVLLIHLPQLPALFYTIVTSAFQGHAAVGAFVGSTLMQTIAQGVARGCYASDIGIGYSAILHAESRETKPARQALLTLVAIFADLLGMCTLTMLLVLVTGTWHQPIADSMQVQAALSLHFPFVNYLMPLLIFFLGYSTVIAFFVFGMKAARFLMPQYGERIYFLYAAVMLVAFSFVSTYQALLLMSLCGVILLLLNLGAFLILRKEVTYDS